MILRLFISFLLILPVAAIAQSTVKSIPNQKLINGSYVSNPDGILDEATVTEIDSLLKSLEQKTSVQVAVVAVNSIGDEGSFEFSQQLFSKWGIGNNDKGLLVLLVKDTHDIRFHTGYGVEGILPDIVCKQIQRDHMVPEFKREDYSAGILAGVKEVVNVLTTPAGIEELKNPKPVEEVDPWVGFITFLVMFFLPVVVVVYFVKSRNDRFKDSKDAEETLYPEMRLTRWGWLLAFAGIPILIVALCGMSDMEDPIGACVFFLYLYFMATLFYRLWRAGKVIKRFAKNQEYIEVVEFLRKHDWYWLFMGLLFPIPFLFYFIYHLVRKRIYRNHPRVCKSCQGRMNKLSEKMDDEYLSEEQKAEEKLESVDYDVWKCEVCSSIEMGFYLNSHSTYQPCPKCKTIAYHIASRKTVEMATYSNRGTGEEIHRCEFCAYEKKSSYTIPKLTRTTSSSIASSSSFGSSSSSSSSGGSWGGGRSGGGGASSSW